MSTGCGPCRASACHGRTRAGLAVLVGAVAMPLAVARSGRPGTPAPGLFWPRLPNPCGHDGPLVDPMARSTHRWEALASRLRSPTARRMAERTGQCRIPACSPAASKPSPPCQTAQRPVVRAEPTGSQQVVGTGCAGRLGARVQDGEVQPSRWIRARVTASGTWDLAVMPLQSDAWAGDQRVWVRIVSGWVHHSQHHPAQRPS